MSFGSQGNILSEDIVLDSWLIANYLTPPAYLSFVLFFIYSQIKHFFFLIEYSV
jgi:hypothetical protein